MTTPTDPTTLRTALEARCVFPKCPAPTIVANVCHTPVTGQVRFRHDRWNFACHPFITAETLDILATPAPDATDPTTLRTALAAWKYVRDRLDDILVEESERSRTTFLYLRMDDVMDVIKDGDEVFAALATPAPAADEARCAFVGCGGVRDDVYHEPCLPGGVFHDHKACHPFQPAPTPAPPTPPATEPVAALVDLRSRFVRDLQDDNMGLFDGEMPVRLDAIVAAALTDQERSR